MHGAVFKTRQGLKMHEKRLYIGFVHYLGSLVLDFQNFCDRLLKFWRSERVIDLNDAPDPLCKDL